MFFEGRAIAQAVSCWLSTAAARVQTRVCSVGICGGKSGAGVGFIRVLRFPLPVFIPPNSPSSWSPGAGKIGQSVAAVPSRPNWTPPPTERLKKNNMLFEHTTRLLLQYHAETCSSCRNWGWIVLSIYLSNITHRQTTDYWRLFRLRLQYRMYIERHQSVYRNEMENFPKYWMHNNI
jgi:hypothetical protein